MFKYYSLFFIYSYAIFAQFDTLNGVKVPSLPSPPFFWDTYILPNETEPFYFDIENLSDAHGLLVSVGSIRTLVIFCWAKNISHLLMADINKNMVSFNKAHLEFIRRISEVYTDDTRSQRLKYIGDLMGFFPSKEQVDAFPVNIPLSLENIRNYAYENQNFMSNFDNSLWPKEHSSFLRDILTMNRNAEILFGYKRIKNEKYYWEDDVSFEKIINALNNSQIAVANIDLVNWGELNDFVKKTTLNWGIVDISNSHRYQDQKTNSPLWFINIEANLFGPQKYLFTDARDDDQDGFGYYAGSKTNFLQHLSRFLGPAFFVSDEDPDLKMILELSTM